MTNHTHYNVSIYLASGIEGALRFDVERDDGHIIKSELTDASVPLTDLQIESIEYAMLEGHDIGGTIDDDANNPVGVWVGSEGADDDDSVQDYFSKTFRHGFIVRGADSIPLDSNCGDDCKRAIESGIRLAASEYLAHGNTTRTAALVQNLCEVFING